MNLFNKSVKIAARWFGRALIVLILAGLAFPASGKEQAGEAVNLAAIYALSGKASGDNSSELRGIRLAVKEVNQTGGVLGRPLKLIEFDNHSSPIGSKVAALKAATQDVVAIIGPSWSSHSLGAAPVAQDYGIPMISTFSTNTAVTLIGDYIFRACYTDPFQGRVMAEFAARDLKAQTAVILRKVTSDYSIGLANVFNHRFTEEGGRILAVLDYNLNQQRFDELFAEVGRLDPDVLFIPGHGESAMLARRSQELNLRAVPLGGDGWSVENFFKMGGRNLKRGYYFTAWSPEVDSETSRRFVREYGEKMPLDPGVALGYDAVRLIADAIGRAKSLDRKLIRDALAETQDFTGVTGFFVFDENGDPDKTAVIMSITDGQPHFLKLMTSD